MKKSLIFLLVCLLMLPLSGCGGKDDKGSNSNNGNVIVDNGSNTDTDKDTDKDTDQKDEDKDKEDKADKEVLKPSTDTESIIVDDEYALIRLEEVTLKGTEEVSLDVYMENKSKTQRLSFFTWTASINGVQIDLMFGDELEPGQNKKGTFEIPTSYLEMCQMEKYTDISVTFVVYDVENMDDEFLSKGTVHYYPYGKENAQKFVLADDPSYKVLMDKDDIKVTCIGFQDDPNYGFSGMLYVENDSARTITVSVDTSTIDSVAADIFAYLEVDPSNVGFVELYWTGEPPMEYDENGQPIESDVEVPNPASAKDIKIELSVYDTEDWEGPHIFRETVDVK